MQSKGLQQDGHAGMRWALVRGRRGDGGPGRNTGFTSSAMALAGSLLVLSCGDGAVEPGPAEPARPATITVEPSSATLTWLGETVVFRTTVKDQYGATFPGTVTWSSSDEAVFTIDAGGKATAVAKGTGTATATFQSLTGTATVQIEQAAASLETVSGSGQTADLRAVLAEPVVVRAADAGGSPVSGATVVFMPDEGHGTVDPAEAVTDSAGLARTVWTLGEAAGDQTLRAAVGDVAVEALAHTTNPDRAVLVALYEATDGPNWVDNTNWLSDAPLGEWYGVETDASRRVIRLDLSGRIDDGRAVPHGLSGKIPPELGSLANLEVLDLGINGLTGTIPPELGDLANLKQLHLWENTLTGPIPPELGGLAELEWLNLRGNTLSGRIPAALGDLVALGTLNLGDNNLSGPIPPELGQLTNLRWLSLRQNGLTGPIPSALGNLTHLSMLSVGSNELTGAIPPWLRNLTNLATLALEWNNFSGRIPVELGTLANLRSLHLSRNDLSGPIPPELGRLTNVKSLYLGGNDLTGSLPPEFAALSNLEHLEISSTLLTGPLPQGLAKLANLRSLGCSNDHGFCVPATRPFVDWIEGLEDFVGSWCNQSDRTVLESFHAAAGGPDWRNSEGWLGDAALDEWHGVEADSLGRVTAIDLGANDLEGQLPSSLGYLTALTELRIGDNDALSGRLPISLAKLPLSTLHYAGTDVCASADDSFQAWLNGVSSHEGTGVECAPITEREILADVYRATGGPNWSTSDKWLTDAPLGEWTGVNTDGSGRVVGLRLSYRGLSGPIPADLGSLANLQWLYLSGNDLSGSIPAELGTLSSLKGLALVGNELTGPIPPELRNLENLETLDLAENDLSGPIPPELGKLGSLEWLSLRGNDLTGPIPPELGTIENLEQLDLARNDLSGPIPPELGGLANLRWLSFASNDLSGAIPPDLGTLANLWSLSLDRNNLAGPIPPKLGGLAGLGILRLGINDLSGPVPSEFGALANLRELDLTNNAAMSGALPASLTGLSNIETMVARGTGLCVSRDDTGLQAWLDGIPDAQIASCTPSVAYLTQAVQSSVLPVPLVANEEALLRVFVTSSRRTGAGMPPVRARFYLNEAETYAVDIPGTSVPIPAEIDEGDLSKSANAVIPGEVVRPGLEIVIEVDPDGTLDQSLGVTERIPRTGRLAVDVREMPRFDLTVVPFLWASNPDSAVIGMAKGMATDPENHELLQETLTLLPVAAIDVTAHEPVMSSSNSGYDVLSETEMIRVLEGGGGHYVGLMSKFSDVGGVARRPGRSSASTPFGDVIAHELGHNMSLGHAPCSVPGPDPWYPYRDGSIGAWGYDFPGGYDLVPGGGLVEQWRPDVMSYCSPPNWISDYYFNKALDHRLGSADANMAAAVARPTRTLLLWGGLDADGIPFLNPAFVADAAPSLPPAGTEYTIEAADADGTLLFSYAFDMPATADAEGGEAGFVFALTVQPEWAGMASITLSGPDDAFTLNEATDRPMAILRDPRTGHVRGFLRDPPPATQAAADATGRAVEPGLDVLFSRGIPDAAAWRR